MDGGRHGRVREQPQLRRGGAPRPRRRGPAPDPRGLPAPGLEPHLRGARPGARVGLRRQRERRRDQPGDDQRDQRQAAGPGGRAGRVLPGQAQRPGRGRGRRVGTAADRTGGAGGDEIPARAAAHHRLQGTALFFLFVKPKIVSNKLTKGEILGTLMAEENMLYLGVSMRSPLTKRTFLFISTLGVLFFVSVNSVGAVSQSTNYKLYGGQVGPASTESSSSNYTVDSGAQPISGASEGTAYKSDSGSVFGQESSAASSGSSVSSGGGGAASVADNTAPSTISVLTTQLDETSVLITYQTDEVAVTRIQYGTEDAFDTFTDAEASYIVSHQFVLRDLLPNTTYKFTVHAHDLAGNTRESEVFTFSTAPQVISVANVVDLQASVVQDGVALSWRNPEDIDITRIRVVRRSDFYPSSPTDGAVIFDNVGQSAVDTSIASGETRYYAVFVYAEGAYSTGALVHATRAAELPGDTSTDEPVVVPSQPEEEERTPIDISEPYPPVEAVIPELPPHVVPVAEAERISPQGPSMFSLFRQAVGNGAGFVMTRVAETTLDTKQNIATVKDGLVDQFGELRLDVYQALSEREKEQVYTMLAQSAEEEARRSEMRAYFQSLPSDIASSVRNTYANLFDKVGNIRPYIFDRLTQGEKQHLEEITGSELPEEVVPDVAAKTVPVQIPAVPAEGDWHVFANTDSYVSLPASLFTKPVQVIIASIGSQAYVLSYNEVNDAYETTIHAPEEKGAYQMAFQIIYTDDTFDEISNTILVDPYGYVYTSESLGWSWKKPWQVFQSQEQRLLGARVHIFVKNSVDSWVEWPAHLYNQINPQSTANDGMYAFVVPPGTYRLESTLEGFDAFVSEPFVVEDQILNINIEMHRPTTFSYVYIGYGGAVVLVLFGWIGYRRVSHKKAA